MLYQFNTTALVIGMLMIGLFAIPIIDRSMCMMTLGLVIAFVTQLCLLMFYSLEDERVYTNKTLFSVTVAYTLAIAFLFMGLSYYYDGDTFMFCKKDAMLYYKASMRFVENGFSHFETIFNNTKYDDWGAVIFTSLAMYVFPSKFFLNAIYIILGGVASVMLFSIGKKLMSDAYAFVGALAYSTSSYIVFYHCSFLKESVFVFIGICSMYFLYNAVFEGNIKSLIGFSVSTLLLVFFRPAVMVMLLSGVLAYYAVIKRGSALSFFLYLGMAAAFAVSFNAMQQITETYTGGDMEGIISYGTKTGYSSSFTYFVSLFSALFGPLPTLFPKMPGEPSLLNFYGAGLTYRTLIILFFWIGIYYAIKMKEVNMIPIAVFVLFEMATTGIIMASQELRKVLPHIPFTYVVMFYGLYHAEKSGNFLRLSSVSTYFAIGLLFLWTIIRK